MAACPATRRTEPLPTSLRYWKQLAVSQRESLRLAALRSIPAVG
jgi:hypothetical protein